MEEFQSKADITRISIVEKAARVFNKKGYAGTSMSDIMKATNLTKGGIYGNFKSKDEIALAAYDYNVQRMYDVISHAVRHQDNAPDKIRAVLGYHRDLMDRPDFDYGCPILNTAIEADDTHPQLKTKVLETIDNWKNSIVHIIENGKKYNQLKSTLDSDQYANLFIAIIEGSVMLSKIYSTSQYLEDAYQRIEYIIENELKI